MEFKAGQRVRLKTTNDSIIEGTLEDFCNDKYPLKIVFPTVDGMGTTMVFTRDGKAQVGKNACVLELVDVASKGVIDYEWEKLYEDDK